MLTGTIVVSGQEWDVLEERRGGPLNQLFTLTSTQTPTSGMQVRLGSGQEVSSLEEVALYAADSALRWFEDPNGQRWEARLVVHSEPDGPDKQLVKFIAANSEVREGLYEFTDGLGNRNDRDLSDLVASLEP